MACCRHETRLLYLTMENLFLESLCCRPTGEVPKQTGSFLLIADTVASPASFIFTILLRRILSPSPSQSLAEQQQQPLVVFVGLNEPFTHYVKIARKQGINLVDYCERGSFVFIDLLSVTKQNIVGDAECDRLFKLFSDIIALVHKEQEQAVWIFLDDLSLLEVLAEGNSNHMLDFLQYCRALSYNKESCSLVMLAHEDVYLSAEEIAVFSQLQIWSDTLVNVQPLSTGHSHNIHGQIVIQHKAPLSFQYETNPSNTSNVANFHRLHYKIMEHTVAFFPPGQAGVI